MSSPIQSLIDSLEAGRSLTPEEVARSAQLQALQIARAGELFVEEMDRKDREQNERLAKLFGD